MTEQHKQRISDSQKRRWRGLKTITYDMDVFSFNEPMSAILDRINDRAKEGWEKDEVIKKDGITIIYKKRRFNDK